MSKIHHSHGKHNSDEDKVKALAKGFKDQQKSDNGPKGQHFGGFEFDGGDFKPVKMTVYNVADNTPRGSHQTSTGVLFYDEKCSLAAPRRNGEHGEISPGALVVFKNVDSRGNTYTALGAVIDTGGIRHGNVDASPAMVKACGAHPSRSAGSMTGHENIQACVIGHVSTDPRVLGPVNELVQRINRGESKLSELNTYIRGGAGEICADKHDRHDNVAPNKDNKAKAQNITSNMDDGHSATSLPPSGRGGHASRSVNSKA